MEYIKKLEQFLLYLLFFAIPFQTRKILYSPGWYYNEWQAISVYATDIILLALFVFWLRDYLAKKELRITNYELRIYDYFLLGFLAAAAISVKNSSDFFVGVFLWFKLVEFALLYLYLKTYAIRNFNLITALYVLVLGGVFQAVIAIGQFMKQGGLGLRWLGESVIGPHMTGVASFYIDAGLLTGALARAGEKVIRAYGTTPHPNILATYLLLAIFAFYFLYLYRVINGNHKYYDTLMYHSIWRYWLVAVYPILLFGLFFTFSRTIIFLWAAGFPIIAFFIGARGKFREQFWRNLKFKTHLVQIAAVTVLTVAVFSVLYWPEVQSRMTLSSEEEAVQLRVFYNEESLKGGVNLFGIGLGDFTGWLMERNPNLPSYMYQPVHNIYLLIYKEIGVIGFALFLLFLAGLIYEFIKKTRLRELKHYSFILVTGSILFMGLFDHFLLTLQQGRFVFWLGLTLLAIDDMYISNLGIRPNRGGFA